MQRYSIKGRVIFWCFPRIQNLPFKYVWYLHGCFSSLVLCSCLPICANEYFFFLFLLYISLKGCSFNMSIGNQRKERDIDNGASWRHGNEWGTWELTAVSMLPQNLEFSQLVLSISKCCTDFQNRSEGFFVLFYCRWRHHDHDSLYKENHLDELS